MVAKKGGIKAGQTKDKDSATERVVKGIKRAVPILNIPKFKKGGKVKKKGKK